ncbi:enoyl-CoA hydratase-related protein [Albimonas sp. CAU 1670]|uniref:enoyl-CoA hydratase-related protein n=1 Tax=Albimonas sp. CAU 1670 TaxID=3032599 RepID=UPI0023DA68CC|nr:enoyl-CoA hydratase-related protein [Albimonas sp. CAU 1670]MDF2233940.1 enoyl-CoA hydratase-related protein [Albimonas sp. CAU 1670]
MPVSGPDVLLVDDPRPKVRRLTLNRPEKRNALSNELRGRIFEELERADLDPDVHVTVIRGAGPSFSAGYDLSADNTQGRPYHTAAGGNDWARHVVEGWFRVWDLAKPVIAQVHGHCLAGGSELAAACDVVYVAEDAQIGYPPTRLMSPPDMQFHPWLHGMRRAMEMYLTGDSISGLEAVSDGYATRAFPLEALEETTLAFAERAALVPPQIQQFNKRAVHRQMEAMGMRAGLRAGTEIQALAFASEASRAYLSRFRRDGASVASLVRERDKPFDPDI